MVNNIIFTEPVNKQIREKKLVLADVSKYSPQKEFRALLKTEFQYNRL